MREVDNPDTLQEMIEALFQRVSALEEEVKLLGGFKEE